MGILDWRLWDRLDDLDRRLGLRRDWTALSWRRFRLTMAALFLALAMLHLTDGAWVRASSEAAFAVILLLMRNYVPPAGRRRRPRLPESGPGA